MTVDRKTLTQAQRQKVAEALWSRERPRCQSGLVDDLLKRGDIEGFSIEDLTNLYPDPSDWGVEKCRDYIRDHSNEFPDPDPWGMTRPDMESFAVDNDLEVPPAPNQSHPTTDDLRAAIIAAIDDGDVDGLDDWRQAVSDCAEAEEVYEWWEVGDWLAERLAREGEVVLRNGYGDWWGRCCTGQSVTLDHVIQSLGAEYCAWALKE